MAKRTIDSFKRATARHLRLNQTNAEERLWRRLRRWPMEGTHFRRQVPIGPYIADFACMAAHLIIEVDGSQHGLEENVGRDEIRTRWLENAGYRVIRFWNNDITNNMDGVLESIYAAVHGSPNAEPKPFKHKRWRRPSPQRHPTPARKRHSRCLASAFLALRTAAGGRLYPPLAGEGEDHGKSEGLQHERST
jgi:very-short-patch-repair endonuclease